MEISRQQQWVVWIAGFILFCVLCSAYLLTYRGFPLSQDEYFIFDGAESLVRRGDLNRTYEFYKFNTREFGPNGEPWPPISQEPLSVIALAPLFWLGQHLPQVGTMHTAWLFNILLTALTGVSLYAGALLLRYPLRIAWLAALIYGLATLAWPYSRHLFREPLLAFFVWWCFVLALLLRRQWVARGRIRWLYAVLLVLGFIGAFLTKAVAVLFLPGLLLILIPSPAPLLKRRRLLIGVGIGDLLLIVAFIALMLAYEPAASFGVVDFESRYSLEYAIYLLRSIEWQFLLESFLGYQVSPARSLWLHSPVLILAFVGGWMLLRRGEWRLVWGALVVVVLFSASYGIAHETSWWGSWGWGPRYMLPLAPLLMLLVLPVFEQLRRAWHRGAVGVLVGAGVLLQLLGMSVRLSNYYTDLNWAGILIDWDSQPRWAAYNWTWQWSPLKYHLDRLDFQNLDFGWRFADPAWVTPLIAVFVLVTGIALGLWLLSQRRWRLLVYGAAGGMSLALIGAAGFGLYSLRDDSRYIEEWDDVRALINDLDPQIRSDSVVFVDREQYLPLVMNALKAPVLTIGLPYSPGENYSGEGPEVISDELHEQLDPLAHYALDWTLQHTPELNHIWLIASSSPFEADKIRPVERFFTQQLYPIREMEMSLRARAIEYYKVAVPQETGVYTDFVFGGQIHLVGYNLPSGERFSPGDVVPVALVWSPVGEIPDDYNVSVQIATLDGFPIVQRDGQPQGTFGRTSQWQPETHYVDNHGLQLPPDIPPGDYMLQVVVYRWQDGQRLVYDSGTSPSNVAQITQIVVQ